MFILIFAREKSYNYKKKEIGNGTERDFPKGEGCKQDLVEQLGVMVINDIVRKNASFIEKTMAFFSSLRPVLCMDPLTGEPSVSITVEPTQEYITIRSIFMTNAHFYA